MRSIQKLMRRAGVTLTVGVLALAVTPRTAQAVTLGEIDVTQPPYNANTGGGTDDTAAFQNALNAAAATGAKVRVEAGHYLFTGAITIPAHVVLEGVNDGDRSYSGYMNGTGSGDVTASLGVVFMPTGSAGNSNGPNFITVGTNAALRNVTIYYPNQPMSTQAGWTAPTAYPPTINLAGRNGTVENVCGINPYMFIVNSNVGSTVRRVVGQPLYFGLNLDGDADLTGQSGEHLEDVHFLNTWDNHSAMVQYMQSHSSAFVVYRADEFSMRNCTCTGYLYGFVFNRSGFGASYGTLTSCNAYNCFQAVRITASTPGAGGGLVFDGGGFGGNSYNAVYIANSNTGNVMFNSCRFYNSPNSLVTNASAAGSVVSFQACSFDNWATAVSGLNANDPCIYCGDSGNPNGTSGKNTDAELQLRRGPISIFVHSGRGKRAVQK